MQNYSWLKYGLLLSSLAFATTSFMYQSEEVHPQLTKNQTEDIRQLPNQLVLPDFRQLAKKAIPAVVSIKVQAQRKSAFGDDHSIDLFDFFGNNFWDFYGIPKRDRETRSQSVMGQASGVLVDPNGYILTNRHVVHDMDKIQVQLNDGREFPAKVLGEDANSDLAVIKIDADDLPYLTLADSNDLEVGEWVAAIGNPFGLQATLTTGVISAKGRHGLDIVPYEDFIQTDAPINRGNSGGPLLTLKGEIAGINTAIATTSSSGYSGIGFAIPSNMARHVLDEIIAHGKVSRGLLGINLQSVTYELAQVFGLKRVEGALITNVIKNSAADRAGLQAEDIILRYNERPVENAASLRNAVYMMKPGTQVTLTILRNNELTQVPVTIGKYSEETTIAGNGQKTRLGIEVENLTPELAQSLGYTQDQGVVITLLSPSSSAALAGLKKGALILAVNRQKISNVTEFDQALAKTPEERPILLQVKQGDIYLFVSISNSVKK